MLLVIFVFFVKQKTAYEMRISDWSSDVCSSDLWRMQESEMSAILALVNAFRPKNEPEAMLAAQMVATHLLTMKVGARALRYDYDTRTAASCTCTHSHSAPNWIAAVYLPAIQFGDRKSTRLNSSH